MCLASFLRRAEAGDGVGVVERLAGLKVISKPADLDEEELDLAGMAVDQQYPAGDGVAKKMGHGAPVIRVESAP